MTTKINLTLKKIQNILTRKGFTRLKLNTFEVVFAKIVYSQGERFSLRVHTGMDDIQEPQEIGLHAIRIVLFWKDKDEQIHAVGGWRRVAKLVEWQKNLNEHIKKWEETLGPKCPKCNSPMTAKTVVSGANKGQIYYGCTMYFKHGCYGTANTTPYTRSAV